MTDCPNCNGSGQSREALSQRSITCPLCEGTGDVTESIANQYIEENLQQTAERKIEAFFDNDG